MADYDERFSFMTALNTPARIARIDAFTVKVTITILAGEMAPFFEFSEAIVCTPDKLEITTRSIGKLAYSLDDESIYSLSSLQEGIQQRFRRMLLYGGFFFEDEQDEDQIAEYFTDNEIVSFEDNVIVGTQKDIN